MRRNVIIAFAAALGLTGCGKVDPPKAPVVTAAKEEVPEQSLTLSAKTDDEIDTFVQSHKHERVTELDLTIDWAKCSGKGFSRLVELTKLERIVLCGPADTVIEKNGNFYFKPIATPDSFAEQISEIKSLKTIQVWYGCLPENQKTIIKKKLPDCEIMEHMNKI